MLDARREQAARLLAEGEDLAGQRLRDSDIAQSVGVTSCTLSQWKNNPVFQQRVEWHMVRINEMLARAGVRFKQRRLGYYDDLARRMYETIKARGQALKDDPDVPGGEFGLQVKQVRPGKVPVTEYHYDASLVRDLLAVMKQSAIEQGDWEEHPLPKPPEQGALLVDPRKVLLDEVLLIRARLRENGVALLGEAPTLAADGQTQTIDTSPASSPNGSQHT